jgi:signal transduction histidine kinase
VCPNPALDRTVIDRATPLDERRALISSSDDRMFIFDGQDMTPWEGQANPELQGRISVLRSLSDGNVAIAIDGKGVFVVSPEGRLLSSLTTPQYHQVSSIASRERGVMWLLTEDAIEKVLYGGGLTSFGQRVGLTLGWPIVAYAQGRLVVASDGVLYQAISADANAATRFERMANQPPGGARTMTSFGRHVLVGSPAGIFSLQPDGNLKRIGQVRELRTLVLIDENQCFAFGRAEIALLEWDGKHWSESAPRIPGLANSFHAHRTSHAVWAEMGGDGVARIARRDGKIHLTVLPNDPSIKGRWVNIGVLGSVAVLSTLNGQRRFFDDATEKWCEMPEIAKLLDRSPRWLARMWRDDSGTIWASHSEGVVKFERSNGDYRMDTSTFDLINDRYPLVQILDGKDVWLSAGRSLHHVEQLASTAVSVIAEPVLVSLMDTRRNVELLTKRFQEAPLQLSFAQNSLTFQLFSGSYARRRPPVYEFRLNSHEAWTRIDTGSLLRFSNLREGKYQLQVRSGADSTMSSSPLAFAFEIMPPWHRTWPAYLLWTVVVLVVVIAIGRLSSHLAHKRNRALEQLVRDRTSELELAMKKFNEETRISATLAERDRLAGEIHDSVQQGLSGAILQLDTTLKLPAITAELRRRLNVVRNMVSYAGQEVQHAVWDMHSPLLAGSDLGEALRKLATHIASSEHVPTVSVTGTPVALPRVATHHLLRIAQEATTNAMRHAKAKTIGIGLHYGTDSVALTISDDGTGFQPDDALNQSGHFGLRGIRGRAKKLGGKLSIVSAPETGTSIHLLVPLPAQLPSSRDAETSRSS